MPLFYTPKPRQFHYEPRYYDPEKEKWEALKRKYATQQADSASDDNATDVNDSPSDNSDDDLRYFEERVRSIDRQKRQTSLSWKDLFRRREMPQFNYRPRFQNTNDSDDHSDEELEEKYSQQRTKHSVRIRRRYNIEDPEYMKPMPAGKIMIYGLLTFLLLAWILF